MTDWKGIPLTARTERVLDLAKEEAVRLGHGYIGTEHLLLALVHDGEGIAAIVLRRLGVARRAEETVREIISSEGDHSSSRTPKGAER